ncbi:uncharacterized protein SPSK_09257 [Sporothrix schenckii 1099-18]|uniref:SUZ-C domain-containing protein n=2 Tax=Sporothrix schenckii TaxID=29908 RepID=U7Q8G0_SPOS1|nr:uncharacterized protein SPSK_09257 [Sporothrix schenckii 1099-18]ERT03041.1 hypothetical protein HMPREF1624_01346 [Sporothrix schenckii ATCC 58251]KJR84565.1 hypothetical protein SPSK_09257 [Sporothrix schenckii 1099-18]
MAKNTGVPNAWDDDWEAQADKAMAKENAQQAKKLFVKDGAGGPSGPSRGAAAASGEGTAEMTRAERLAKHEEDNRRLWNSADNPEEFHFLSAGAAPGGGALLSGSSNNSGASAPTILPAASAFRPQMTVLSRKPAPRMIRRRDPVTGIEELTVRDDAAEAEAEAAAAAQRNKETPEQIRQRQQREREAKQRKYDEARAKIFGEPLPASSSKDSNKDSHSNSNSINTTANNNNNNTSTPGSLASSRQPSPAPRSSGGNNGGSHTPPHAQQSGGYRGKGRGRGQGGAYRGDRLGEGNGRGQHQQHDNSFNRRQPQQQQQQQQQHQVGQNYQNGAASTQNTAPFSSSPSATPPGTRELYDPNYSPKPQSQRRLGGQGHHQHAGGTGSGSGSDVTGSPYPSRTGTPREEEFVVRAPRGPDSSGRGGFGFARRGGLQSD